MTRRERYEPLVMRLRRQMFADIDQAASKHGDEIDEYVAGLTARAAWHWAEKALGFK